MSGYVAGNRAAEVATVRNRLKGGRGMELLPFTTQEYEGRLEKIRQQISQQGLDALVLTRPAHIYYASGYRAAAIASRVQPLLALVIPAKGEPRLMTGVVETATVKAQWTRNPRVYKGDEDPFKLLSEILQGSGAASGTLGIEERFVTVRQLNGMKQALPDAGFMS